MNRQVLSVPSDRPTVPSRVITLSQAPALAPWLLSGRSPGLVFILAQHHRPGDARRLVRQRNGYDQRRPPPTQPDHPRIGFGRLRSKQIGACPIDEQPTQITVATLRDTAQP